MYLEFLEWFKAPSPLFLFAPRTLEHNWNYMRHTASGFSGASVSLTILQPERNDKRTNVSIQFLLCISVLEEIQRDAKKTMIILFSFTGFQDLAPNTAHSKTSFISKHTVPVKLSCVLVCLNLNCSLLVIFLIQHTQKDELFSDTISCSWMC